MDDEFHQLWLEIVGEKELESENYNTTYKSKQKDLPATINLTNSDHSKNSAENSELENNSSDKTIVPATVHLTASKDHQEDTILSENEMENFLFQDVSRQLSHYQTLDEIAKGGMGVIYSGYQSSLCRNIAIKKIRDDKLTIKNKENFVSESLITALLEHPNIVPVYELGQNDKEILLAMKLIAGTPWRDLIYSSNSKYDLLFHLEILLNVCNAIAFAHSKNIVHNDLKPDNVMVGEFGEVLVMDWGIAVDIGEALPNRRMLHKSDVINPLGTPSYMPAELAEGRGSDLGPWTDIFLLGAILYEVIAKKTPYPGKSVWKKIAAARAGKISPLGEDVPQELTEICYKALAKDPKQRHASVLEFQESIRNFLKHRESIIISNKAQSVFEYYKKQENSLKTEKLYNKFAQSIAGFQQALELWDKNPQAIHGKYEAKLHFAEIALRHGDLGLAESQAKDLDQARVSSLLSKIAMAQRIKRNTALAAKRLRLGFFCSIVVIIIGLTIGIFRIKSEQQKTEKQRLLAIEQRLEKEKDARICKIRLAKIALTKAKESARLGHWDHSGVYAGEALEIIKDVQQVPKLKEAGKNFVASALDRSPLIWQTANKFSQKIQDIAYSPDGIYLAMAANDSVVRLWEVKTGKLAMEFLGHTKRVNSVAFGPAGSYLLSCAYDSIRLWKIKTSKLIKEFKHIANRAIFSPDGKYIAFFGKDNNIVKLQNIKTGKLVEVARHKTPISAIAFGDRGNILASGASTIKLWDMKTHKEIKEIKDAGNSAVTSLAFNHTSKGVPGKILAASYTDKVIRFWDMKSAKCTLSLMERRSYYRKIVRILFNPDDSNIIISASDRDIKLWDIEKQSIVQRFKESTSKIVAIDCAKQTIAYRTKDNVVKLWNLKSNKQTSTYMKNFSALTFNHTGKVLASGLFDGTITLWDLQGNIISQFKQHRNRITDLEFSFKDTFLASSSRDKTVKLWNIKTKKTIVFSGHRDFVTSIAFSPDQKVIASSSRDKTVRLWDIATARLIRKLTHHRVVADIAFSSNNTIVCSLGKKMVFWDCTTGKQISTFNTGFSSSIAFNKTRNIVAIASSKFLRLWDVKTTKQIAVFGGHKSRISKVLFGPLGNVLASASDDHTVKLWDLNTSKKVLKLKHKNFVSAIAFHPGGKVLASVSGDNILKMWDIATATIVHTFSKDVNETYSVAFSPNGGSIVSTEKTIKLWDINGKQTKTFKGHKNTIYAATFSSNSKYIASAGSDKTARLWDINGNQIAAIKHPNIVFCAKFSPDNKKLFSASTTVKVYDLQNGKTSSLHNLVGTTSAMAFHPRGKILAFVFGYNIWLWDLKANKQIASLKKHKNYISSLVFSPDGKTLASSSWDQTIVLWNTVTYKPMHVLAKSISQVYAIDFHPDGKMLASAEANIIRLWDTASSGEICNFVAHKSTIMSLNFNSKGNILASAGLDKNIKLWDITRGKQLFDTSLIKNDLNTDLAFSFRIGIKKNILRQQLSQTPKLTTQEIFKLKVNENLLMEEFNLPLFLWDRH